MSNELTIDAFRSSQTYVILPSDPDRVVFQVPNFILPMNILDFGDPVDFEERGCPVTATTCLTVTLPVHNRILMFGLMSVEIYIPSLGLHARIRSPQKLESIKTSLGAQIASTVNRRLASTKGKPTPQSEEEELATRLFSTISDKEITEAMTTAADLFIRKNQGRFSDALLKEVFLVRALRVFDERSGCR